MSAYDHQRVLSWADRHFETLQQDMGRFEKAQPDPLVGSRETSTGEYVLRFDKSTIQALPDDWVFQIGDVIHNMRVALDYLTFQIVKPPLSDPKLVKRVSFPIVLDRKDWDGMAGLRIPGVSDKARGAFESLQPYNRSHTSGVEPLLLLDSLENIHKHRELLAVGLVIPSAGHWGWGEPNFTTVSIGIGGGPLDDGAEVYRLSFLNPTDTEPNRQFHVSVMVCFDKKGDARGLPVILCLEMIRDHIRDVVFPRLEPFL